MDKYIKNKLDSFGFSLTQQMLLVDVIKHVAQQIANTGGIDTSNLVTKDEFTKKTNSIESKVNNIVDEVIPNVYTKQEANDIVDTRIQNIVGAAPEALDTLEEIADRLKEDDDAIKAINEVLTNKVNSSTFNNYTEYIRTALNNFNEVKANSSDIPTKISELQRDDIYVVNNINKLNISSNIETIINSLGTYENFINAINNKKLIIFNNNILTVIKTDTKIVITYLNDDGVYNITIEISIVDNNYNNIIRYARMANYAEINFNNTSNNVALGAGQGKILNDKITELAAKVEEYHPAS